MQTKQMIPFRSRFLDGENTTTGNVDCRCDYTLVKSTAFFGSAINPSHLFYINLLSHEWQLLLNEHEVNMFLKPQSFPPIKERPQFII